MQSDYIKHHGIRGQRWGVRRFQNKDGTLTSAGEKRYYEDTKSARKDSKATYNSTDTKTKKKGLSDKQKKALKIGAAAVGTVLAAYGGYKLYQAVGEKSIQSKKLSTEQLKSIGIKTFEPERIKVDTIKVDKTPVSTFKPTLEFNTSGPEASTSSRPTQTVSTYTTSSNIKGSQAFNKAAQANDDFINELLNKNSKILANF